MSTEVTQAIAAAFGTLLIAVLGYLAAVVSAHTKALTQANNTLLATTASARQRPARASDQPGGAAVVRPYPLWNQNDDPLPTGALPSQGYNECGEECCAEVIMAQHGVEVEADALRAQLRGPGGQALTTAGDLVKILGRNNVGAVALAPGQGELQGVIAAAAAEGRPTIVLGRWISPDVLHWVLVTTADAGGCQYNDPWGGVRRAVTWDELRAKYAGSLVEVTRRPDPAS